MTRDNIKVEDKRHWAREDQDDAPLEPIDPSAGVAPEPPATVDAAELDAMRARAESAERKLREVQEAFLAGKAELDRTRERLERDLDRKVSIKFGELVSDLLETADDLDRAIGAGSSVAAAAPVVEGIALARDRFQTALVRAGVTRLDPTGEAFDPNLAEAVGVSPVDDPAAANTVVCLVRAGYAIGDRVVRPARVLIGRLVE